MLSFGALWIGGRGCPEPEKERAMGTGKGELQGCRRTGGQLRAQQLEHTAGFFYHQEPVAIGKCLLSLLAEQFPVTSPIHGTDRRPSTLTLPGV